VRDYRKDAIELIFKPFMEYLLTLKITPMWIGVVLIWVIIYFMIIKGHKNYNLNERFYIGIAVLLTIVTIIAQVVLFIRGY